MCKHKILAYSQNGYIVLCNKCNQYRIAFGTTLICLSKKQYELFKMNVKEQLESYRQDGFPEHKNIRLPTFSQNVQIVVNYLELEKIAELICDANATLEIEELIYNLENGTMGMNN
jgi:hypothetical protein